jgi:rhodanese-related sulfurtransferase
MSVLGQPGFWWGTGAMAVGYAVVAGLQLYSLLGKDRISATLAKREIADGRIKHVIDVRTQIEWDTGHFPGAIHVPVANIPQSKKLKSVPKSAGVLVYCNTGQRARRAAVLLQETGYKNVRYIAEGYGSLMSAA